MGKDKTIIAFFSAILLIIIMLISTIISIIKISKNLSSVNQDVQDQNITVNTTQNNNSFDEAEE